jgi:hypothetical protein
MDVKTFYLAGETVQQGLDLDISHVTELLSRTKWASKTNIADLDPLTRSKPPTSLSVLLSPASLFVKLLDLKVFRT